MSGSGMIGGGGARLSLGSKYSRDILEGYSSAMGMGSVWAGGLVGMGVKRPVVVNCLLFA